MRSSLAFILGLVAIPFAATLTVPEGATDGFYVGFYDENGQQVHVKNPSQSDIDALSSKAFPPPYTPSTNSTLIDIAKRDRQMYCGCGYNMNHGDCDSAVEGLKVQFDPYNTKVPSYMSYYTIRGSVVAFVCNHINSDFGTNRNILTEVFADITNACGWYVAGTWDLYLYLNTGYMNYYSGLDFCGSAQASSASSC